jgi:dihydrofolate synthase/folylpolyglutamate synthase
MTELPEYARFLARLREYEHMEPFPSRRRPDKLAGIQRLLERLGKPQQALRIIHVAGTNGKGMTATMIARLLGRRGASWGLYTSPHVVDIRERIALNGRWISQAEFARAGHAVLDVAAALREQPPLSYFDLLTAIGLLAFSAAGVAWAVLETGLGGAADATNVTPKELCVLTRIGLDHQYVLGATLHEIAAEKLGILRPGVPVVVAEQEPELAQWLAEQVQVRGAAHLPSSSIRLVPHGTAEGVTVTWRGEAALAVPLPRAELTAVRLQCAATALVAVETALGPAVREERAALVARALSTRLPGRLERRGPQRIVGEPGARLAQVILDGGHNAQALEALNAHLETWGIGEYTLILGMQADKLVEAVRAPLARLLEGAACVLILPPQTARAATAEALAAFLDGLPGGRRPERVACAGAREALRAAARHPQRPLVAAGSFWMLGDVMRLLEDAPPAAPPPPPSTPAARESCS